MADSKKHDALHKNSSGPGIADKGWDDKALLAGGSADERGKAPLSTDQDTDQGKEVLNAKAPASE
ncbi:hypothetical protein [Comamonas fluminis]|uniref:hypothetical protein n=1 Tax=Comamonas fluminis TaxID=2796366 RepID=UPI001C478AD1|nr:hypothetical protein [Comamonas fluminis]